MWTGTNIFVTFSHDLKQFDMQRQCNNDKRLFVHCTACSILHIIVSVSMFLVLLMLDVFFLFLPRLWYSVIARFSFHKRVQLTTSHFFPCGLTAEIKSKKSVPSSEMNITSLPQSLVSHKMFVTIALPKKITIQTKNNTINH